MLPTSTHPLPYPKPWITPSVVRGKNPAVDLKLAYGKALRLSLVGSALCLGLLALLVPGFESRFIAMPRVDPVIIIIDDIPETVQDSPAPLPLQAPGASEGLAVRDTTTAKEIDLDFLASMDLSPGLPRGMELDEETVGFWTVSREPVLIKEVIPEYPQQARQTGLEGTVFVKFAVGSNGHVKQALVLKGAKVFHPSALRAVYQFQFIPAMQNDTPVAVWMTLPIRFQLLDRHETYVRRPSPGHRSP